MNKFIFIYTLCYYFLIRLFIIACKSVQIVAFKFKYFEITNSSFSEYLDDNMPLTKLKKRLNVNFDIFFKFERTLYEFKRL